RPALPHPPILRPIFLLGTPLPPFASGFFPLLGAVGPGIKSKARTNNSSSHLHPLRFCPITTQFRPPSCSRRHSNWHRTEFDKSREARAEHRQRRSTLLQTIYHRLWTRQPVHGAPSSIHTRLFRRASVQSSLRVVFSPLLALPWSSYCSSIEFVPLHTQGPTEGEKHHCFEAPAPTEPWSLMIAAKTHHQSFTSRS
ncbi:hypothetical protein CORC01_03338, partial [Colletotrichum orchidophilum]